MANFMMGVILLQFSVSTSLGPHDFDLPFLLRTLQVR